MALSDTITAINCVNPCDAPTSLSETQFLALLINKLSTATGIDLSDITSGNLLDAVKGGLCELKDVAPAINASPETMRAIALYIAGEV